MTQPIQRHEHCDIVERDGASFVSLVRLLGTRPALSLRRNELAKHVRHQDWIAHGADTAVDHYLMDSRPSPSHAMPVKLDRSGFMAFASADIRQVWAPEVNEARRGYQAKVGNGARTFCFSAPSARENGG